MNATLSFSTVSPTPATPAVTGEPAPGATASPNEMRGVEFADLLRGQLSKPERQDLAAPAATDAGLQLVALGPKIDLLTTDAPLPDVASLAAFARAQGLDEAAVVTLFGQLPKSATDITAIAGPMTLPEELPAIPSQDKAVLISQPVEKSAPPDDATALLAMSLAAAALLATATAPNKVLAAPSDSASANTSSMDINKAASAQLVSVLSLQVSAKPQELKAQSGVAPLSSAEASHETMQDAIRVRLELPTQELTRRLSMMTGTSKLATWGALSMGASDASAAAPLGGASQAWETLHMDMTQLQAEPPEDELAALPDSGDPVSSLSAMPAEASASRANNTESLQAAGPTQAALTEQRAAQSQQLADRLGQAVAQRLIAQIERGQWKLQLRMEPASLGRIDVALDMHAGGLDAMFTSDNAMTRELIAQGSAKLKDTLAESGMPVASMWVNGEQSRQTGGNPTPGRDFNGGADESQKNSPQVEQATSSYRNVAASPDGLDVLA